NGRHRLLDRRMILLRQLEHRAADLILHRFGGLVIRDPANDEERTDDEQDERKRHFIFKLQSYSPLTVLAIVGRTDADVTLEHAAEVLRRLVANLVGNLVSLL